jgi:hypothetical protein
MRNVITIAELSRPFRYYCLAHAHTRRRRRRQSSPSPIDRGVSEMFTARVPRVSRSRFME